MATASEGDVARLRAKYKPGDRVVLLSDMEGERLRKGYTGTINHIDDIGTIHVRWDVGSTLGIIPGIDTFRVIR